MVELTALLGRDIKLPGNVIMRLVFGASGDSELSNSDSVKTENRQIMPATGFDLSLQFLCDFARVCLR